jgi:hypothetical protein
MKMKRFNYLMRQKIEDPGPIKLRTIFPHTSVLSKPPQLPHGVNKSNFSCVLERPSPNLFLWKNPTRHLSRVAPLDTPLDIPTRLSPPAVAPFSKWFRGSNSNLVVLKSIIPIYKSMSTKCHFVISGSF